MKRVYEIEVVELREVRKTYYIEAQNKSDARKRAKESDWDDASADDPTFDINKVIIKSVTEGK